MMHIFSPGDLAGASPQGRGEGHCGGCRKHPSNLCAACGRAAVWWLPMGEHALTLCQRDYDTLQAARAETAGEKAHACGRPRKWPVPHRIAA